MYRIDGITAMIYYHTMESTVVNDEVSILLVVSRCRESLRWIKTVTLVVDLLFQIITTADASQVNRSSERYQARLVQYYDG